MLRLMPRQVIYRLSLVALTALVSATVLVAPAFAKGDPQVKRIKKELLAIEHELDRNREALDSVGARWDALEQLSGTDVFGFSAFVSAALGSAEQSHLETAILHSREAIAGLERDRDKAIRRLEKIVAKKQAKELAKSGVSPATMPSLNVNGSLITYSADWEQTAMCESTKRWHINSRYDGGLQFDPITWIEFGGGEFARYAYEAPKMQQIAVAERVLAIQGPGAWPNCFRPLPNDADG